jgi:hypothetical protein
VEELAMIGHYTAGKPINDLSLDYE